jgi:hypothetical protein
MNLSMWGKKHLTFFLGGIVLAAACGSEVGLAPTSSGPGGNGQGGSATSSSDGGNILSVGSGGANGSECANTTCEPGETCSHGVCVPGQACDSDNDCWYDTYCDMGVCKPWDSTDPSNDPQCVQVIAAGVLAPSIQCEFASPPASDPFPNHVDVQGTPIVVNTNKSTNSEPTKPGAGPSSIAASFTATVVNNYTEELGVIRVIDGKDCSLIANLGGTDLDNDNLPDYTVSSASLAAADLDGDGLSEIVAYGADGSLLAFTFKAGAWKFYFKSPYAAGMPWSPCSASTHRCSLGWAGPSIHDLNDDGFPEIIREGVVYAHTGAVLAMPPPGYSAYSQGTFPVVANLDQDPAVEFTNGQFIWEWDTAAQTWKQEAFPGNQASSAGHVAVADFGEYGNGLPAKNPEIVVVRAGTVRIHAADGELAMPPTSLLGGGSGGPPTVSDFDGDGLAEVAVAAKGAYSIYDIDCGPLPRPNGVCPTGTCDNLANCPAYVAWSRVSQDFSSSVTGSSVFDFEADGSSEVVYGDECFTRVYDGTTGEVLFSQFRSSCTWYENPIVADVDGDFRAELVTPSNKACSADGKGRTCEQLNSDGVDPLWNGIRCEKNSDCVSNQCDGDLCRCTAVSQCCGAMDSNACSTAGYKCVPPEASGEPSKGNTCRAAHPAGVSGIRVYSDANDLWVNSRRIWNQHAYAVTHVNENGTVPKTSQWMNNWDDPKLNNFRQNVPGEPNAKGIGDATAGASDGVVCMGEQAKLQVDICNRGALAIGDGMPIGFYVDDKLVCSTTTTQSLFPSDCEVVACIWATPPNNRNLKVDVKVVADDGNSKNECKEGNNIGLVKGVFCQPAS